MRQVLKTLSIGLASCLLTFVPAHAEAPGGPHPMSQADRYFDPQVMAEARAKMQAGSGGMRHHFFMLDRLEGQFGEEDEALVWDGFAWFGGDTDKLWLKSEGTYSADEGALEEGSIDILWSRQVSSFFDLQVGARYAFEPEDAVSGVLGFHGLAPQWIEVDGALSLSTEGVLEASFEAERDILLTQRLVLQPRIETDILLRDNPASEVGAGVTQASFGARLRYEVRREFAPYVGVEWERHFGRTARLVEAEGGDKQETRFVVGLRVWF